MLEFVIVSSVVGYLFGWLKAARYINEGLKREAGYIYSDEDRGFALFLGFMWPISVPMWVLSTSGKPEPLSRLLRWLLP